MKKTLIIALLIALTLSLTLVACKTDDEVSIVPETLKLEVGSEVDWNGHVVVKVNGKAVANPQITWEKAEGNEQSVGMCRYVITYVHNGQSYTRDAFVNFTNGVQLLVLPGTHNYKIGDEANIDWKTLVTVTIDDVLQQNPELTATLKSGDKNVAGNCVYTVKFSRNGKDYTVDCTITYNEHVRITPTAETQNVVIGDEIDWTQFVAVYVDDVLVNNPDLSVELISGEPEDEDLCVYEVGYEYEGKTYTAEVRVRYKKAVPPAEPVITVAFKDGNTVFKIGEDWTKALIVKIDYVEVENPLDYLTVTLKEGDPTIEGKCTYTVTVNHENLREPLTAETTVSFLNNPPDATDVSLLNTLLQKVYDSYTFTYHYYEVGNEKYYMHETDKVQYTDAVNMWEIAYEEVNKGETEDVTETLDYFFSYNPNNSEVRLYLQANDDSWKFYRYEGSNVSGYARYAPMAFIFEDLETPLNAKWFVKTGENEYSAHEVFLQDIADAIFGVNEGETYESIVITTDGNDITSVSARSTTHTTVLDQTTGDEKEVTFTSVITLSWSNFDSTTVTLPQATEAESGGNDNEVPEYVDPATGEELTDEQKTAFNEALGKTYQSITLSYNNDKGDMFYRYSGVFKLTPVSSYTALRELGQYKDWIMSDITEEYYMLKLTDTVSDVWKIISSKGDFIKYSNQELSLTYFATYVMASDFGFTADMFNYVNGLYVIKSESINAFAAMFGEVFELTGYTKFDVLSFTVKLDGNGNVEEWRLVADCAADNDVFYWDLSFTYSNFNSTTVTLPDSTLTKDAITAEQRTELEQAIAADYSNVTVNELVSGTNMYFMGDDVTVIGKLYDEASDRYTMFTDVYKIADGKYYEVVGGIETEITLAAFEEYVLRFHFELINLDNVTYDKNKDLFYISAASIDADEFALYMKDAFGEDAQVTGFAFQVKDGRIVSVTTYFNDGDILVTAELSNFGTTTVPQNNPESGATEE